MTFLFYRMTVVKGKMTPYYGIDSLVWELNLSYFGINEYVTLARTEVESISKSPKAYFRPNNKLEGHQPHSTKPQCKESRGQTGHPIA